MGYRPVDPADHSRMKTYSPKPQHIERRWYVVDAQGQTLGRMASEVAALLRGKHKPIFAPHMDTGDHVIVVNAGGIVLTPPATPWTSTVSPLVTAVASSRWLMMTPIAPSSSWRRP